MFQRTGVRRRGAAFRPVFLRFDRPGRLCYTARSTLRGRSEKGGLMPSFEMIYEEDEDVLEVTFEMFDENFARTIPLNDNIVLYTDTTVSLAWGVTFYSYARLLQVSETHLDGLRPLPEADVRRLLT